MRKKNKDISKQLKTAINNENKFKSSMRLLLNQNPTRENLVSIAELVYGWIPKNTSKKAAIEFIQKPHGVYMRAKKSIDAMGGRSAA